MPAEGGAEQLPHPGVGRVGRVAQGALHVWLQAGDPAAGPGQPHHLGEQVKDSGRAAAEIDHALAWPEAHPVEQRGAVGPQFLGLALQPRGFAPSRPSA